MAVLSTKAGNAGSLRPLLVCYPRLHQEAAAALVLLQLALVGCAQQPTNWAVPVLRFFISASHVLQIPCRVLGAAAKPQADGRLDGPGLSAGAGARWRGAAAA